MNLIFSTFPGKGYAKTLGPYVISSILNQNGFPTKVIEFFDRLSIHDIKFIAEKYINEKSHFIGFSSNYFSNMDTVLYKRSENYVISYPHSFEYMKEFFRIFKNQKPDIKFLYGGMNSDNRKEPPYGIDYMVKGYADNMITPLVHAISKGIDNKIFDKIIECKLKSISPVIWKTEDILFENEHLPLETSRGCYFRCPYCVSSRNFIHKDIDVLKLELIRNHKLGIHHYFFTDVLTTHHKTIEVLNMILTLPFDITWNGFAKISEILKHKNEYIKKLPLSGCEGLVFGIESLNDKTLQFINKGPNIKTQIETLKCFRSIWQDNVNLTSAFICGLPYDNKESIIRTVDFLNSDECPLHQYYMGSLKITGGNCQFTKNPEKWGYIIKDGKWYSNTSDLTQDKAGQLVKSFYDKGLLKKDLPILGFKNQRENKDKYIQWRKKWLT